MNRIDILLQGEAIADVQLVSLDADADVDALLEAASKLRGAALEGEFLAFLQDEDAPMKKGKLPKPKPGQQLSVHVNRCRKIAIDVTYNGVMKSLEFAPARTVGAAKTQSAVKLFGMSKHDAAEHVLQLAGTDERPDADTHVGSLAEQCRVAFDLVPLVRVEG